jgi:hypothetical protein
MLLHMKLFANCWMPRMAGKRQMMSLAVEPQHLQQMNATWNKWNLSLNVCSISCTAIAKEVRISPASVYSILTNSLGKWKVCAKWIPHMLKNDQRAMHVLLATTYLQRCRKEDSAFCYHTLAVYESWMHSFDPQLKWQNADWCPQMTECWLVSPNATKEKKNCTVQIYTSYFWAKMDLCLTIPCQLVKWSVANITAHSCRIRWGQLFTVNNQNDLSTVSVCFRTMQHLIAIVMCKIWCDVGAEGLAHSPLQILHWLLVVCSCERSFWGKQFESDDDMNTAVSASLHCLCKDEYRDAIGHLTRRWYKCVDSAGGYIEWKTFV